jgi:hypothetical protein
MAQAAARRGGAGRRAGLALAATAAVLLAGAPSAAALIVTPGGGHAVSYLPLRGTASRPFDAFLSDVDYNGGPVMPANANYTLYWDPSGGAAYPSDYRAGIDRFLTDLGADSGGDQNVDSVATQYNDAAGNFASYSSRFAGRLDDADPYPANGCSDAPICLTTAQIEAELARYITAHGLPRDRLHEYFVLTPPGVEGCIDAKPTDGCSAGATDPSFCAYHSEGLAGGLPFVYANDPYVTGNPVCDDGNHPNASTADGALQGGLVHEHDESITDPLPDTGWYDFEAASMLAEIGDKCVETFGSPLGTAPNGADYNQLVNGHPYWYQEEYSNQGRSCLQRFRFTGTAPTAAFTATGDGSVAATFDAGHSTAPGGVLRYAWQWGEGDPAKSVTETSAPTATHTFSRPGTYTVALTVYAPDGTSIGAAHPVRVPFPPANLAVPAIVGGATQGQALTLAGGSWSNTPTSTADQWLRCDAAGAGCQAIAGATTRGYTLAAADVGATIRVDETASNAGGSAPPVRTAPTAPVSGLPPASVAPPAIAGTATLGQVLTVSSGGWTNAPTSVGDQWLRCDAAGSGCQAVVGAAGPTYPLTAADVGATIRVAETATNAYGGAPPATSRATAVVPAPPPPTTGGPAPPGPVTPAPKPVAKPAPACAGLSAGALARCRAQTTYRSQIGRCNAIGTRTRSARARRAACLAAAALTRKRALAAVACRSVAGAHARAACLARARRLKR